MNSIDWEKEADRDVVFATEREELIKQEYYSNTTVKPAKITYKKYGIKTNTKPLSTVNEKSI